DILDGRTARDFKGPDGEPFVGVAGGDLGLQFRLSVDWFNPQLNKQSGKKVSTGHMSLTCLDLPPSVRYKSENIYLARVIPGPNEPSLDQINHYL
ncbi:hypothetical protein JAAARDRAFT_85026, partial [Jaapia argillacea MUCL 33604]